VRSSCRSTPSSLALDWWMYNATRLVTH
jgi:hypothetical protein